MTFWQWVVVLVVVFLVARPIVRGFMASRSRSRSRVGSGEFDTPVVGEAKYQDNLLTLCGGRARDGVEKYFKAKLVFDDANPYDQNAVRVDIADRTVGYLSREAAPVWRKSRYASSVFACDAVVRGGWDRGRDDQGHFGVWLDLPS